MDQELEGISEKSELPEIDYQRLEDRKKNLLNEVTENPNLTKAERNFLVFRIFEHSIEDGLDMADKLSLDHADRIHAITRSIFCGKHIDFVRKLESRLIEYTPFANQENKDDINELILELSEATTKALETDPEGVQPSDLHEESKTLLQDIDDYYANFISLINLKEKDSGKDRRTKGEYSAERALEHQLRSLEQHYYTETVQNIFPKLIFPFFSEPLISESRLAEMLKKSGLTISGSEKQKLERAKYNPMAIAEILQREGEDELKKEMLRSLKSRGYTEGKDFELVFDEDTKIYKVIQKIPRHNKIFKRDLRETMEVPNIYRMQKDDPLYDEIIEYHKEWKQESIDGDGSIKLREKLVFAGDEVLRLITCRHDDDIVIFPDGHRTGVIHAVQEVDKINGHISYLYNAFNNESGGNNFQIAFDGERVFDDNNWDSGGPIVSKDGTIYCRLFQFDYDLQEGRCGISKNGKILRSYGYGTRISNFRLISDTLAYTIVSGSRWSNRKFEMVYENTTLGPYKQIQLSNDTDRLVFAATKENGTSIIHFDGQETELSIEGNIEQCINYKDKVYILSSKEITVGNSKNKIYSILDEKMNFLVKDTPDRIYDFSIFSGKLTYVSTGAFEGKKRSILHSGDKEKDISSIAEGSYIQIIGEVGKDLLYRYENSIYSINAGRAILHFKDEEIRETSIVNGKLIISLHSKDKERVVEWSENIILSENEQRKLALLNALKSESAEVIDEYFKKYYPNEPEVGTIDRIKKMYQSSKEVATHINSLIKESPLLFVNMFTAKKDDITDRNVDNFISSLFPELQTNLRKAQAKARSERNYFGLGGPGSHFSGSANRNEFYDGDPKEQNKVELVRLREPISDFLAINIYGKYDKKWRSWQPIGFPLSQESFGPTTEITAEIPIDKSTNEIVLPKSIGGSIIPERIRGVKNNGESIQLVTNINSLGEVRVSIVEGVEKILYSQTIQDTPSIPSDISAIDYREFRGQYEKRFGLEVSEKISSLPEELIFFLKSIADRSPIERVEEIESFVREIGFYDMDNKEVQYLKKNKSIEETIAVMSQRMKEIKRKDPEKAKELEHKKFAGVCSDFAKLTSALLRESGIISGMISGLQPDGNDTIITTKHAHAISYALFPANGDRAMCVPVDGTPNGVGSEQEHRLSAMRLRSLKERRKDFIEKKKKIIEDSEKDLEELEYLISNLDEEGIRKLRNGQLEKVLNNILSQVRDSHLAVIDRVLNASRYAGFDVAKLVEQGNLDNELSFRNFLELEITQERNKPKENKPFRGAALVKTIEGFASRFEKDLGTGAEKKVFDILDKVLDISRKYLDPIESRSAAAVITYLRAEHMLG